MKTMKTILMAATVTFSLQSFATQCWVVGQNPQDASTYDQLLKYISATEFAKSDILFKNDEYMVSKSVDEKGNLSLATSKPEIKFLSAAATGGQDRANLLDGNLKVSIMCTK
ncbi:MAG: hypothetical protein ACAH59_06330 [Pseudobdellovibrionaceae bacterium]